MEYSNDRNGVVYVRDDRGVRTFDKPNNIAVPGWEQAHAIRNRHKNVNTTSGKAETR